MSQPRRLRSLFTKIGLNDLIQFVCCHIVGVYRILQVSTQFYCFLWVFVDFRHANNLLKQVVVLPFFGDAKDVAKPSELPGTPEMEGLHGHGLDLTLLGRLSKMKSQKFPKISKISQKKISKKIFCKSNLLILQAVQRSKTSAAELPRHSSQALEARSIRRSKSWTSGDHFLNSWRWQLFWRPPSVVNLWCWVFGEPKNDQLLELPEIFFQLKKKKCEAEKLVEVLQLSEMILSISTWSKMLWFQTMNHFKWLWKMSEKKIGFEFGSKEIVGPFNHLKAHVEPSWTAIRFHLPIGGSPPWLKDPPPWRLKPWQKVGPPSLHQTAVGPHLIRSHH